MPDPKNPTKGQVSDDDIKTPATPVSKPKEQEPDSSTNTLLEEIQERSKDADKHAERQIQEAIGNEAKLKEPEVEISPDVADSGVEVIEKEASKVATQGGTIDLPMTEDEYRQGEQTKIKSHVTKKLEVFGISSILALALYVGRMVKLAHHYAKKVKFRKSSKNTSEDKKDF